MSPATEGEVEGRSPLAIPPLFVVAASNAFAQALPNINSATVRYNSLKTAAKAGAKVVLAARSEDAADHNIPLLVWYGLEPLVPTDPPRAISSRCALHIAATFLDVLSSLDSF
mgnify:CR=1 FL=1